MHSGGVRVLRKAQKPSCDSDGAGVCFLALYLFPLQQCGESVYVPEFLKGRKTKEVDESVKIFWRTKSVRQSQKDKGKDPVFTGGVEFTMKFIKNCPFFVILFSTGLLFTIIALGGKNTIYAGQEYDPLTAPVLSVMFTAVNDEIYPWQLLANQNAPVMAAVPEGEQEEFDFKEQGGPYFEDQEGEASESVGSADSREIKENASSRPEENGGDKAENDGGKDEENGQTGENKIKNQEAGAIGADALKNAAEAYQKEETGFERLQPLRESTREEYLNHISADIYGDAGVIRAAACEFETVDESYFDDALFIGDSRFVGLKDYTDLAEHADFLCETSLTIYKAMEEHFSGAGTVSEVLAGKDYRKIYMMLGINELGRGTTEDFMGQYTEVVDTLRALEPEAKIFIMGIMRVSGKKSGSDAIFNNSNINARNNAVATLADNKNIFYIDVNEVVCDEEGNLNEEYTFDQIHLLGARNDLVKQFLMEHGVAE